MTITNSPKNIPQYVGKERAYFPIDNAPFQFGRTSVFWKGKSENGETICIKLYRADSFEKGFSEYINEMDILKSLNHPNILRIIDYGLTEMDDQKSPFVILPLCDGDLRQLLRKTHFLSTIKTISIVEQIGSALDYAHNQGIVHSDIKPENILHTNDSTHFFLADFGIAAHTYFEEQITGILTVGGTTAYLSPEHIEKLKFTTSSDIYSLSLVTYEMLTGDLPFDNKLSPYLKMKKKIDGELIDPSEINPKLESTIIKALLNGLEINPKLRPKTARDFLNQLTESTETLTKTNIPSETDSLSETNNSPATDKIIWLKSLSENNRVAIIIAIITILGTIIVAIIATLL